MSYFSAIISKVESDVTLSRSEKIQNLEYIASQARDLRRASGSPDNTDDTMDDLAAVQTALAKLT
ncbi:hypothetical protein ACSBOB_00865 [Mesorhizobium sp. ASY16-5R]|uniref:hypothetical protein n=1 Tax=Mesorhizobium sp. ASY16-5R TaxID=3445772 RepID=UPI003FA06CE2